MAVIIRTAKIMLKRGPAATIESFTKGGLCVNDFCLSATSSSGDSPSSLTYPPSGKAEITYSVSPHFFPISFGPKPRENF